MQKYVAIISIVIVILYGIFNTAKNQQSGSHKKVDRNDTKHVREVLCEHRNKTGDPNQAAFDYVVDVINHGSSKLHFKKEEVMEGGYIPAKDAPAVACYVLHLSHKPCPDGVKSDNGELMFGSVCAGCHGNDGKGIGRTYPDLTRQIFMGMGR